MTEKPSLYVCSTSGFCGKSIVSLGLALTLQDKGFKVGYLKPVGWEIGRGLIGEKIDRDAELMAHVLNIKMSMEHVVPVIFGSRFLEESEKTDLRLYEEKILDAYGKAAKDKDLMILEGTSTLGVGSSIDIDPISLSKKFRSRILMVSRHQSDATIDSDIWVKRVIDALGGNFAGQILNQVHRRDIERVRRFALPIFKKCGVDLLGIIPEEIELMAPTVREICDKIKCEVLAGEDKLDNLVEEILVGAMSPESSLTYFRRSFKKAVVTGGDRADIQLAALETDLSALILTGNIYPDAKILSHAEDLKIPVLLVPWDTYTTVRALSHVTGRITPQDDKKIKLAKKLVEDNTDWEKILSNLNIK